MSHQLAACLLLPLLLACPVTAGDKPPSAERLRQLISQLGDEDADVRESAKGALWVIDTPAVSGLVQAMRQSRSWRVRSNAAELVAKIAPKDPAVLRALIRILQEDKDELVRQVAAGALGEMRPRPKAAVPALVQALREDRNGDVRLQVAFSVAEIA